MNIDVMILGEEIPVSKKLIIYLANFIEERISFNNKNTEHYILLGFNLYRKGNYGPTGVHIPFRSKQSGNGTATSIMLPFEDVIKSENPQFKLAELMIDGFKLYFSENKKKMSLKDVDTLSDNIDYKYLSSIPNPPEASDRLIFKELFSKQI